MIHSRINVNLAFPVICMALISTPILAGERPEPPDYADLFQKKSNQAKPARVQGRISVDEFSLTSEFSLYTERQRGGRRSFAISTYSRTFLRSDCGLGARCSDYLDLINITNKVYDRGALSPSERAFLDRAKPVFRVHIRNSSSQPIALRKIVLKVEAFEHVMGGGSRILRPEIMYEIEVPTRLGTFVYPVKNPLLVEPGAIGSFLLGLNSTNEQRHEGRLAMYPQIEYRLRLSFDFGAQGSADVPAFDVLL